MGRICGWRGSWGVEGSQDVERGRHGEIVYRIMKGHTRSTEAIKLGSRRMLARDHGVATSTWRWCTRAPPRL